MFLQQAAYITNGVYFEVERAEFLLQFLLVSIIIPI
jgi:hypothetical protein